MHFFLVHQIEWHRGAFIALYFGCERHNGRFSRFELSRVAFEIGEKIGRIGQLHSFERFEVHITNGARARLVVGFALFAVHGADVFGGGVGCG